MVVLDRFNDTKMSEIQNKCVITNNYMYKDLLIAEQKYLVGVCKNNDQWQFLLTNLVEFYEESLTKEDVMRRCEEMNPFLVDIDYEEILNDLLIDIPKYTVTSTVQCISLAYKIEGGKFLFSIILSKTNSEHFHGKITESLYYSFSELYHRYNHLIEIVRKKDEQIEEYKAQGTELLRKSLVTEPFTEKLFDSKFKNTKPIDKINVFLNALNFHESMKKKQSNKVSTTEKLVKTKSESQFDEGKSNIQSNTNEVLVKRPLSSEMRCAVGPKYPKRVKSNKQGSAFKYL